MDTVTAVRTKLDNDERTVVLNLRGDIMYLGDKFTFESDTEKLDETIVRFTPASDNELLEATYRFKSPTMRDVKTGAFGSRVIRIIPEIVVRRMIEQCYETESIWH